MDSSYFYIMIIKSVKLENIRSYTNKEIVFPEGSLLLSGDVGSGKSSILLAAEFALFGMRGKKLSGNSLLRNGKNEGSVELKFSVDRKEIIIKRKLKRSKDNVGQSSGYIVIDGIKREATPIELKAAVVDILGYPKELVSKSKDLLYRYTVYTPQEEMKQILSENEEERLDTLRRVFGIDKYKRIRGNCDILLREMKERKKELEGRTADIEDKKTIKEKKEKEMADAFERKKEIEPKLEAAKKKVLLKKKEMADAEKLRKEENLLKREIVVNESEIRNAAEKIREYNYNKENDERKIAELEKSIFGKQKIDIKAIENEQEVAEQGIILEENRLREIEAKVNECSFIRRNSAAAKDKIMKIAKCQNCFQDVSEEHRRNIVLREDEFIKKADIDIAGYNNEMNAAKKKIIELNSKLKSCSDRIKENSAIEIVARNISDKKNNVSELIKKIDELNNKKIEIEAGRKMLLEKMKMFEGADERYNKIMQEVYAALDEQKKIEIEKNNAEREIENIKKIAADIEKEIEVKTEFKKKLEYVSELQLWIEESFSKLMSTMEKHVMMSIYNEFNSLFNKWFSMLMGEEGINAKLDDNFAPVIEQNGYETSVEFLSGGERTAAALSYRLALNKVVNDMMSGIKTKDLIILDEPTDGFSAEQLDRLRDVLDEIGAKQIIIVSHESKMESFVENVIKINKSEHMSEIG